MKKTTSDTLELLSKESFQLNLDRLKASHPDYEQQETTTIEMYNGMMQIKDAFHEAIEMGIFESLPFSTRNELYAGLKSVDTHSKHQVQSIVQYNSLQNIIHQSRLTELLTESMDVKQYEKEIIALRRKYRKLVADIKGSEGVRSRFNIVVDEGEKKLKEIENIHMKTDNLKEKIDIDRKTIEESIKSIAEAEQEVENRKQSMIAFGVNIDENQSKLNELQTSLRDSIKEDISSRTIEAEKLISEAETALELKQTEGISKAYSNRLKSLSDSKSKSWWLFGAGIFVTLTLIIGYLLTGGGITLGTLIIQFKETSNAGFLIGRVALTALGVSGAVFCANRFVTLRDLEEDYEYKVVLTKSILAFANKLKKLDATRVPDYLTQVLKELHQDPLRSRKPMKNKGMDLSQLQLIAEIYEKIKSN
jgi:hypothetical protein